MILASPWLFPIAPFCIGLFPCGFTSALGPEALDDVAGGRVCKINLYQILEAPELDEAEITIYFGSNPNCWLFHHYHCSWLNQLVSISCWVVSFSQITLW